MNELPLLYEGSVKDIRGPIRVGDAEAVVFDYTDAYSVFDWGRMPDPILGKGQALAAIAADWFRKLEDPEFWKAYSRATGALALRKANRFGAAFNEIGEELQRKGLRTHFLGVPGGDEGDGRAFSRITVRRVSVVRPAAGTVLGRSVYDYEATRRSPDPRLIPLEVVFRFGCPAGSSLLERAAKDPGYMASIGFGDLRAEAGARWDFPVLELFTKLETTDRPLTLSEAVAISGVSVPALQAMLFKTAWVAGALREVCSRAGLELADGKLEWAIVKSDRGGDLMLVDAIGPDELRLLRDGMQLSKEFLRAHYRGTAWYEALSRAKREAAARGSVEWKKAVTQTPQPLPPSHRELASQLYQALANALTDQSRFPKAWPLEKVVAELKKCQS